MNPHIVIQPNSFKIDKNYISKLKKNFDNITLSKSYSGEGIIISNDNAKGVILKGIDKKEKNNIKFFDNFITQGNINNFKK